MADVDLEIKKGETYPGVKGFAFDAKGPLPLDEDDEIEVRIKSAGHFIQGQAEVIEPPEEDASGHLWNWRYLWAAGDTDNLANDYQMELWRYIDKAATPPRIQKLPNKLTDNPTMAIVQDLVP